MLNSLISAALKLRFAMWAVELVLPGEADLKRRLRSGLSGVVAAVAGGAMLALSAAVLLFGAGYALNQYANLTVIESVLVVFGITLLLGYLFLVLAGEKIDAACNGLHQRASLPDNPDDVLQTLFNGFLEGLALDPAPKEEPAEPRSEKAEEPPPEAQEKPYSKAA